MHKSAGVFFETHAIKVKYMNFGNDVFDTREFKRSCIIFIVVMLLQKISSGAGFALLVPIILLSITQRKPEKQIFWILITVSMMMGNPNLMPRGPVFFISNRLVMGIFGVIGFLQLAGQRKSSLVTPLLGILFYLIYMIIPSQTGYAPIISNLKLFLFIVVFLAYFGAANMILNNRTINVHKLRAMMLAMASFFIIGSVLLIPFPSISQLSGEAYLEALKSGQNITSLFMGMTFHSQSLGPIVCVIFTFLFADLVFNVRKWNMLYILLFLLCPILIYKTSSRAGMASFILGVVFVGWCLMIDRKVGLRWRSKVMSKLWLIAILCLGAVFVVPSVRDSVVRFALKYNSEAKAGDFSLEEAMATRQYKMDESMEGFHQKPILGNGFQVAVHQQGFQAKSMLSLLSAPVEKGVWVTAILEEGGIIGMIIFLVFAVTCGLKLLARRAYTSLACFFVLIVSNMAEFTMFSMSAMGGVFWAFIFIGAAFDGVSQRKQVQGTLSH